MKILRKVFSMLLVFTLLIGTAACGGDNPKESSNESSTSVAVSIGNAQETDQSGDLSNPKYPEPITINMIGQTFDDLDNQLSSINETFEDNRWTKLVKEKLNIDIKYTFVAKDPLYQTKLKVVMASSNLPDIFAVNPTQFKQLIDNDLLADLNDAYDKYMGVDFKTAVESDPLLVKSATFDGKIKGLGNSSTLPYSTMTVLWLRYDWIKKLGLSEPKNMDDLFNIAKAFKESNPDGVPVTGSYGITKDFNMVGFDLFCNAYHAYNKKWVEKDGKLVYGSIQPEMKTALATLAKWYKADLIDKEFLTKDEAKVNDEFLTGKVGMTAQMDYYPLFLTGFNLKHPEADLRAYPMVSADDVACSPQSEFGENISTWYVVRKGFEHPEALMKMTNLANETLIGKDANTIAQDGTANSKYYYSPANASSLYISMPIRYNLEPDVNLYRYKVGEGIASKDPSIVQPSNMFIYENMLAYENGDTSQWGWYKSFCKDYGGAFALKAYKDSNVGFINAYRGLPTKTQTEKSSLIDTKINESFAKIIMGAVDINTEFDKCIKNFNAMGGSAMTEEVNTWYSTNKGN